MSTIATIAALVLAVTACSGQDTKVPAPTPSTSSSNTMRPHHRDTATLAGGCFWCIEAVFLLLDGVESVESGYCNGTTPNPTYKEVCSGTTGHAEACRITFDPAKVSFEEILHVFFSAHDPTTLNRQGNDVGTQYRSAIFYHDEVQKGIAEAYVKQLTDAGTWPDPIVTEIAKADTFYVAEDYHQDYYRRNGSQPYCAFVVRPKVEKFKKQFQDRLKSGQ